MNEFYKRSQTQNQDYSIKTKYKSNKLQNQFMLSEVRLLMLLWEGGKEIWVGFLTRVLSTTGKFDLKKKKNSWGLILLCILLHIYFTSIKNIIFPTSIPIFNQV